MHIHPEVPAHQFDPDQRLLSVFVVLGPGHCNTKGGNRAGIIKTVRFGPHTMSPLLGDVDWIKQGDRIIGVRSIKLSMAEERAGSRFLKDLYDEEGRADIYQAYCKREKAIHAHQPVGKVLDGHLPKKVLQWRALVSSQAAAYEMPALEDPAAPAPAPASAPQRRPRAATPDAPAGDTV